MTWRDELQQGKFRDVPFHTDDHGLSGGRRLAVHEYPLRDDPFPEDMGRAARKLSVRAYVLGADYMGARDNLLAALEAAGPGTLVHPYLGTQRVAVESFNLRESTREGGIAYFDIQFVQAGAAVRPDVRPDTATLVTRQADVVEATIEQVFVDKFSVADVPGWVSEQAAAKVGEAVDAIIAAAGPLPGLMEGAQDLIDLPGSLAGTLTGAMARLRAALGNPEARLAGLRSLFGYGADDTPAPATGTTPSRARVLDNAAAVGALVRQAAVVEAAREAAAMDYESFDQAQTLRDELADAIDDVTLTADDASYAALVDLRAAVVRDIALRGADLSRLVQVTPAATLPALVLAHQIHGDATRAEALVARNRIRHPGMVPGGVTLEVLANG